MNGLVLRLAMCGVLAFTLVLAPAAPAATRQTAPLVAYTCELGRDLDICVMSGDGTGRHRLVGTQGLDVGPEWSPDGTRLLFLCRWDSSSENYVLPVRDLVDFGPIGFARNSGGEVCIANADGTGLRRLTTTHARAVAPAWSPDGTQIAFASRTTPLGAPHGTAGIFVVDVATGKIRVLTRNSADDFPAWSPDGARVAFTRDSAIAVTPSAGGSPRMLTRPRNGNDLGSSWSADGSKLAFTRYTAEDTRETWVMNANGNAKRRLTSSPAVDELDNIGLDFTPRWSPDGTRLAVTTGRETKAQGWLRVSVVATTGGAAREVSPKTSLPRAIGSLFPTWSPDGSQIAFLSDFDGHDFEIYSVAPDGSGQLRLTSDASEQFEPAWQPSASG